MNGVAKWRTQKAFESIVKRGHGDNKAIADALLHECAGDIDAALAWATACMTSCFKPTVDPDFVSAVMDGVRRELSVQLKEAAARLGLRNVDNER
jgi:hypothetical protein